MTRAEASKAFLRQTMAAVQDGLEDFSCPVCLRVCRGQAAGAHPAIRPPAPCDEEVFSEIAAAPCMHLYCVPCLTRLARSHGACATCQAPLRPDQWTVLGRRPPAVPMAAAGRSAGVHGAKIAAVVAALRSIQAAEPGAKCLLYCQWDDLKLKMLGALQEAGLEVLTLQGDPRHMRRTLEHFQAPGPAVLFLSLQRKAAGMNLQCAHHVLLAHPFWTSEPERAVQWEAQAIGRAHRPGQVGSDERGG